MRIKNQTRLTCKVKFDGNSIDLMKAEDVTHCYRLACSHCYHLKAFINEIEAHNQRFLISKTSVSCSDLN